MIDRDRRDAGLIQAALVLSRAAEVLLRMGFKEQAVEPLEAATRLLGMVGRG